jgi:hypothetical protein
MEPLMDSPASPSARYANSAGTDVAYDPGNGGSLQALKPDDPLLIGIEIAPYPVDPRLAVMAAWQARLDLGLPLVDGRAVQLDPASREALSSSAAMAQLGGLPEGFGWRLADNSTLALDTPAVLRLAVAAGRHYFALFAARSALLDAVAAGQVADPTQGWPELPAFDPAG